jgi:predicted TIM-barrel fold metal-dependent hydrolase
MIIDTHFHIGRGEMLHDSYQVDCTLDRVLSAIDESGVDRVCIMPVSYADYAHALEEVREAVAAHPGKLIGFARVNLKAEGAIAQLRRGFEEYGFRGAKLHSSFDGFPTREFMEVMTEFERPLLLHAPGDIQVADAITTLARAYPSVPVICGHMGGLGLYFPTFVKYYAAEAKHIPNLYLDTGLVMLHHWIRMAVDICGPEKVLFGSDGPAGNPAVHLKMIEMCHFSESENAMILGENARRLLRL